MTDHKPSGLKRILLATDFSTRSDRAERRALLLARQHQAHVTLVHVVDDDQPRRLVASAHAEASRLLQSMQETLTTVDRIDCDVTVAVGEAFAGALEASEEADADLIVIGPHRRQILKDVFTGTTAERIIRNSLRPVLMVNGTPTRPYRNALLTCDLSPASFTACRCFNDLALMEQGTQLLLHVFDAPATGHMRRASLSQADIYHYVAQERSRAEAQLRQQLQQENLQPDRLMLRPARGSVTTEILEAAKEGGADLIVVGSRGQTAPAKLLLGSTTEALMRVSERDVLAVPAMAH